MVESIENMKLFFAVAFSLISLALSEPPPPSYLPPFELTAPSQSSFSSYASPKPTYSAPSSEYGTPSPSPIYNAPSPSPIYSAPSPAPVYRAPSQAYRQPRPTYSAPKASYSAPKPVRYSPPSPTYLPSSASSSYASNDHDDYDSEPANYMYQYSVHDPHHGTDFGHKESREGDVAHGQYMVLLPDGRRQIVDYVADKNGYRPTIRYEGESMRHGY